MAKQIHLDFLQYLLVHQNPNDNYFNRYFLLKSRLNREKSHSKQSIDRAQLHLLNAGFIKESNYPGLLYITEEGTKFFHQENKVHLMGWLEKFTQHFNKKYMALATLAGLLVAAAGVFISAKNTTGTNLIQFLSISVINIKQSIFG